MNTVAIALLSIGGLVALVEYFNPGFIDNLISGNTSTTDNTINVYGSQGTINMGAPVINLQAKVVQFSQAIAYAEGFGKPGAVPTTHHNPGDLSPGDTGYAGELHSGSIVSQLPDDATGWNDLYRKVENIFTGKSSVYSVQMTIEQMAQKYAGDWQNWSQNVAAYLGVSPKTTLATWLYT